MMNDHNPAESAKQIQTYITWIQNQVGNINADVGSYNTQLPNQIRRVVEQKRHDTNRQLDALAAIGIPLRENPTQDCQPAPKPIVTPVFNDAYHSVAISYGSPDKAIAEKIYGFLTGHGINTWYYPKNGLAGEKLHRMMSKMTNEPDRVIVLCSRSSLHRNGVLNEIERVLEREAKEAGSAILIPLALDEYVYEEWVPEHSDTARQIRSRNILKINSDFESTETSELLDNLKEALYKISFKK
jgi:hypothetical protein